MAQTVGFGKLEREVLSNSKLPPDLRVAVIEFKNELKAGGGNLEIHENEEGNLPTAAAGQVYYEYDVGAAHAGDAGSPRGRRRLVALVDAGGSIRRMFFHDDHYRGQNGWQELQWP